MPKICRFPIPGEETEISVNPVLVRYLRAYDNNRTTIFFDNEHKIVVEVPMFKVEELMNVALNFHHT